MEARGFTVSTSHVTQESTASEVVPRAQRARGGRRRLRRGLWVAAVVLLILWQLPWVVSGLHLLREALTWAEGPRSAGMAFLHHLYRLGAAALVRILQS